MYFVGTNEMPVGLHVPTNFQWYRSPRALWGEQLTPCPPPPPGYAGETYGLSMSGILNQG